jgi:hypothetical protein
MSFSNMAVAVHLSFPFASPLHLVTYLHTHHSSLDFENLYILRVLTPNLTMIYIVLRFPIPNSLLLVLHLMFQEILQN